jgi:hypothetical protein
MKQAFSYLVVALLFFSAQTLSAQYRPFEKYNFDEGGYILVGVFEHHSDHPVQKSVGEFYTDDVALLNAIKEAWNFPREQRMYACGYHYHLLLMRQGTKLNELSINLECNEVVTDTGSRVFDSSLLTRFSSRLQKLVSRSDEFPSIEKAREYWKQIKQDEDLVYAYEPEWLEYEGSFRLKVQCPAEDRDCYKFGRDDTILAAVREKITTSYPGEKFEVSTTGGTSAGEAFIEIKCNKTLESKFDIYDRWNKEAFGKWQPFHLYLRSYWKK